MKKHIVLIFLCAYLVSCHKDTRPDVIVVDPPIPKPKPSNCIIDDSLTKPLLYYHGDTNKGVNAATLNYYYSYFASTTFDVNQKMKLAFQSLMYYDARNDYIKNALSFANLPCTYDTIFLHILDQKAYLLDLPIAIFSFFEDDVPYEDYSLDTTRRNYILITSLDTLEKKVQAEYWVQFLVDKPKRRTSSPDVLRFCDGMIRVKY